MIDSIRQFISNSLVEDEYDLKFGEEETEKLAGLTVDEFCALVAERTGHGFWWHKPCGR